MLSSFPLAWRRNEMGRIKHAPSATYRVHAHSSRPPSTLPNGSSIPLKLVLCLTCLKNVTIFIRMPPCYRKHVVKDEYGCVLPEGSWWLVLDELLPWMVEADCAKTRRSGWLDRRTAWWRSEAAEWRKRVSTAVGQHVRSDGSLLQTSPPPPEKKKTWKDYYNRQLIDTVLQLLGSLENGKKEMDDKLPSKKNKQWLTLKVCNLDYQNTRNHQTKSFTSIKARPKESLLAQQLLSYRWPALFFNISYNVIMKMKVIRHALSSRALLWSRRKRVCLRIEREKRWADESRD